MRLRALPRRYGSATTRRSRSRADLTRVSRHRPDTAWTHRAPSVVELFVEEGALARPGLARHEQQRNTMRRVARQQRVDGQSPRPDLPVTTDDPVAREHACSSLPSSHSNRHRSAGSASSGRLPQIGPEVPQMHIRGAQTPNDRAPTRMTVGVVRLQHRRYGPRPRRLGVRPHRRPAHRRRGLPRRAGGGHGPLAEHGVGDRGPCHHRRGRQRRGRLLRRSPTDGSTPTPLLGNTETHQGEGP